MKNTNGALAFLLAGSLGLACGGTGLAPEGQGGSGSLGGAVGSGGAGGAAAGGAGGALGTGGHSSLGGSATGGGLGSGGKVGSGGVAGSKNGGSMAGGRGGANAGGAVTGGTGGILCPPVACPAIGCPYGELPNPDPCGCPICAPRPDAGVLDAIACPPIACPAIGCPYGELPNPDPCGCPICAPRPDAGVDGGKMACVDLDECRCRAANGCAFLAESCYCPYPQCGAGACVCGGGKFIGCVPVNLSTCDAAKARVAELCPSLHGPTFDKLCEQSSATCITKCLGDVTSCDDVFCTFCEDCKCTADPFSTCVASCSAALD